MLKAQLEAWKLMPVLANSGKEALNILSNNSNGAFDLIITDMNMPEMDGAQVATAIRKMNPALSVILLSSIGDEERKTPGRHVLGGC
ncbi:MAG: response regulator [Bacteroidota bacterium]